MIQSKLPIDPITVWVHVELSDGAKDYSVLGWPAASQEADRFINEHMTLLDDVAAILVKDMMAHGQVLGALQLFNQLNGMKYRMLLRGGERWSPPSEDEMPPIRDR